VGEGTTNSEQNLKEFEELFRTYFTQLCQFALKFTRGDLDEAKEIVQLVFIKIWEKYDSLDRDLNFRSYLFTAVNNRGLNYIRDRKKIIDLDSISLPDSGDYNTSIEAQELERAIILGINNLPPKCRQIFELSRFEGLKYKAIAEKLDLSVKTIEVQMSKALKILREHLSDFLVFIILLMI